MGPDLRIQPVEIAPHIYWVGRRDPGSVFHSNPYLLALTGHDPKDDVTRAFNLLVDPGSSSDFSFVRAKVGMVIGGLDQLSALFINHQDPDVGSSASVLLQRFSPRAGLVCSERTWRLIRHFNLGRDRFVNTDRYADGLPLPTGHRLMPVPTPHCHAAGAVALYEPNTRVLFTGDLFGGLTEAGAQGLWADESDWAGMRAFHQLYMPTGVALRHAMHAIRALDPAPKIIAPQHGRLLRGHLIQEMMARLEALPVGADLMQDPQESPETLAAWNSVMSRVWRLAASFVDEGVMAAISDDRVLAPVLDRQYSPPMIERGGQVAVERTLSLLTERMGRQMANLVIYEAVTAAGELDLPAPVVAFEEDEAPVPRSTWLSE